MLLFIREEKRNFSTDIYDFKGQTSFMKVGKLVYNSYPALGKLADEEHWNWVKTSWPSFRTFIDIYFYFVLILCAFATPKFKFWKASAIQKLLRNLGMKTYPLRRSIFSPLFTPYCAYVLISRI